MELASVGRDSFPIGFLEMPGMDNRSIRRQLPGVHRAVDTAISALCGEPCSGLGYARNGFEWRKWFRPSIGWVW